jgi:tRNA dimethylallyltransferase
MPSLEFKLPLIVIAGPTAVGKTELSIQLAERLGGEIISADSRLFYRGMDIGTAKPTLEERKRVPHHLIDVAEPDEIWSLPIFQKAAQEAVESIHQRKRLPILVGGTGQYVRAVTEGWSPPAYAPNPNLRRTLEEWAEETGPEGMHTRLTRLDPQAAERILPGNLRRTIRALEVIFQSGRRFSEQQRKGSSPYQSIQIGLIRPREELYARVDARIEMMFSTGLVEEVRGLLENGYSRDLPTLSAIGYGEVCAYLNGEISMDEAICLIKRRTRQFVRRQSNWFRLNDPEIRWFQAGKVQVEEIIDYIRAKGGLAWTNPG